jgi:very-short-patch-repair endonuclease
MSRMEETFAMHLQAYKISHLFEREHRFHPERKWRFDFACKTHKVAIELQGGIFGKKSGHNTGVGIRRDMQKNNEAQRLGWRVFHFYVDDVKSGEAVLFIKRILEA